MYAHTHTHNAGKIQLFSDAVCLHVCLSTFWRHISLTFNDTVSYHTRHTFSETATTEHQTLRVQ